MCNLDITVPSRTFCVVLYSYTRHISKEYLFEYFNPKRVRIPLENTLRDELNRAVAIMFLFLMLYIEADGCSRIATFAGKIG